MYVELSNGVKMPKQMIGSSICDYKGSRRALLQKMNKAVEYALTLRSVGLDTARDYGNEEVLGKIIHRLIRQNILKREDIFITTKVGNDQQRAGNMKKEIDSSLAALKLEYIDLWLLHWPLPGYWIDNWNQMTEILESGKVRAIGVCNCRERHLDELTEQKIKTLPHVIQIEYHPFRSVPGFRARCEKMNIQLEAYSSNCLMLPFVKNNPVLKNLSEKYQKTISQIIARWHIQQKVVPIFSSFNPSHIQENVDVFDFELSDEDMQHIFSLNIDYKFHPESMNCPGY